VPESTSRSRVYLVGMDALILPVAQRFAAEGAMPNLARLMADGAVNEALSCLPVWTPTNWATLCTGAHTGTHGLPRWEVDMPDGKSLSSFHSAALKAETIWEAAERQGLRSVSFHYPCAMPSRLKEGYAVDGFGAPHFGATPFEITPSRGYTTRPDVKEADRLELGPAEGWGHLPRGGPQPLAATIAVRPKAGGEALELHLLVTGRDGAYDRLLLCSARDAASPLAEMRAGEWSDWMSLPFRLKGRERTGTMRFKLEDLSDDARDVRLYRSQVMPTDGWTDPGDLGPELIERFGPFIEHISAVQNELGACEYETAVEEAVYQAEWIGRAGAYMMREKGCRLFYCHYHFPDWIGHHYLARIDPASPRFEPDRREWALDRVRQAYAAADRLLGPIIEDCDEDTVVIVVSDHGNSPGRRSVDVNQYLLQQGFITLRDASKPLVLDNIDPERTLAYRVAGLEIRVLAKGPEYEATRERVLTALRTWTDPDTGTCPVAFALRKEDAGIVGMWGDQVGDIVLSFERGYVWAGAEPGTAVSAPTGPIAAHGPQLPSTRTEVSSNMAAFVACGPGIKRGYTRPHEDLGYVRLVDVVPTVCHLLGIEPPAQCEGHVLCDMLEGREAARSRPAVTPTVDDGTDETIWTQKDMHDLSPRKR